MREPKLIRTCSIWRALEVVGDTSTLLILEATWIGARRFEALRTRTGLQRALLSDRLARLVEAGILRKEAYSSAPPRFDYRLTQKGQDLYWAALMMRRWERRWSPREGKLDIVLRHRTCGEVFEPTPTCRCCGDEITAREVDWTEGPGVGWMAASYSRRRQQRAAAAERDTPTALLDEAAQIAGDRWASLVLRSIFTGIRRFDDIRRDTAMASNILAERLSWLAGKGVVRAEAPDPASARHEYRLTEKGVDYYPILLMLLQWGDAYYVAPQGPPLLLRHRGHELQPVVTCSCCVTPVRPQDVTFEVVEAAPTPLAAVS
ncbi:MAG: transcriptional regulator [Phenylobacterium zucineum]|nr:MAG: transcriptional regulator [Phenylobacterium zucineum]